MSPKHCDDIWTAMMEGRLYKHPEMLEYIVKERLKQAANESNFADIESATKGMRSTRTLMEWAVMFGNKKWVEWLEEKKGRQIPTAAQLVDSRVWKIDSEVASHSPVFLGDFFPGDLPLYLKRTIMRMSGRPRIENPKMLPSSYFEYRVSQFSPVDERKKKRSGPATA